MRKSNLTIKYYQTKDCKLAGTNYSEIYKKAWKIYLQERRKSKRRAYVRSAYFKKDKVFLDIFWNHLKEKHHRERIRRLKFYNCAIILLKKARVEPVTVQNPNKNNEKLYRFHGKTKKEEVFIVQITENEKSKQKYLISVFPK